ncbi:hypothetical protein IGI04_042217 [Brassica rapa subsp. trilocularis]|uniref:Uncharacterized protein n=1 Tax=Brassica rapa subsp. trilocularis TaxID=1813537 RepID=A0ABQ7KKG1_BRACM|nr:hypothetical protein IGI04_042217 [Brassica rapa subsp. trilocularis]
MYPLKRSEWRGHGRDIGELSESDEGEPDLSREEPDLRREEPDLSREEPNELASLWSGPVTRSRLRAQEERLQEIAKTVGLGSRQGDQDKPASSFEKLGHDQIIFTTLVRLINTSHTACPLHRTGLDLPLSTDFTAFLEKLGNDQMSSHSAIAPSPWHHQLLGKAEWIHQLLINHFTIEAALINSPSSLEPRLEGAKLVMIICIPMELGCLNHHRETHKTHFSLHNDPCYTSCSLWTGYVQWYYAMAISHCIINHTTLPVDYGLTCPSDDMQWHKTFVSTFLAVGELHIIPLGSNQDNSSCLITNATAIYKP